MDPEQYKEETKRNDKIMRAYERLLDYVKVYTTSEDGQEQIPSTMRQFDLARQLAEELKELGVEETHTAMYMERFRRHRAMRTVRSWALSLIWIRLRIFVERTFIRRSLRIMTVKM